MLQIPSNQIQEKKLAGMCKHGPVLYILTKGGLHALFTRDDGGKVKSLAAGPHAEIARFFAERNEPTIQWHEGFLSKSDNVDLSKSENTFQKMRQMFWAITDGAVIQKSEASDLYFVYPINESKIHVATMDEIKAECDLSKSKSIFIRPIDLREPPNSLYNYLQREV